MFRHSINAIIVAGTLAFAGLSAPAKAESVTLKLHQFLPPTATVPGKILRPWADRLAAASGGRIIVEHYDAMALGGRPSDLYDQAREGVIDISSTIVGYTPGRFPRTEVFELPFFVQDPVMASKAFWKMVETDFQSSEFDDVKVLGAWVHGPGVIHSSSPVTRIEDMQGLTIRGPTRMISSLLGEMGANPIGMPLPAVPEALSKGVIAGTVIPWEVAPSVRIFELVRNHAEFPGPEALYTATIILVMNKDSYEALPDDLRAILDAESGEKLSAFAAQVMLDADAPAREMAVAAGNNIIQLDQAETERWKAAAAPIVDRWIAEMNGKGIDGAALIERARALLTGQSQ